MTATQRELLDEQRRAVLATQRADGRPRLVPIAYAVDPGADVIWSALDEKPKSVANPRALGRVRDVLARPAVSVLVDRWSEDWAELAWLRLDGQGSLLEPDVEASGEHRRAVAALRERYPQYAAHALETRPVLRIAIQKVTEWKSR